jgi:hypothetical protein
MTAAQMPDVLIKLNQRRWPCIIEPTLALSPFGLPLVKQLGELLELWIVREFWHMLDYTDFYAQSPELLLGPQVAGLPSAEQANLNQQVMRSLQEWERLRLHVDPATRNINFLADVIGESCVPAGADSDLIWRWESLAQSLDGCLGEHLDKADTLTLAYRDLAALAAARPACILTKSSVAEQASQQPPAICTTLTDWGIPCRAIGAEDAIASLEREQFRNVLVHAGLSKLLWAGLNLVVLHLVVPAAATLNISQDWLDEYPFTDSDDSTSIRQPSTHLWEGAQGFWYSV